MMTMIASTLALLLAGAAAPAGNPLQSHGDWIVGCDNARDCEAQGLVPDGAPDNQVVTLVTRTAGGGSYPRLEFSLDNGMRPTALFINGKRFVAKLLPGSDRAEVAAADTPRVLTAMAKARKVELRDAGGRVVAQVSPLGMTEALRAIDDIQGRSGTVSATVAKGPKAAGTVPSAYPLPVLTVPTPAMDDATQVRRAEANRLRRRAGCPDESSPSEITHKLPNGARLLLVSCGAGAYNAMSIAYVATERLDDFDPARFDHAAGLDEVNGLPQLANARWDAQRGVLTSRMLGRGIGDCGSTESFAWDGAQFRLVEAKSMGECRGSPRWITTYRTDLRYN